MSHLCHAHGCQKPVPPSMLFCRPHWFKLRAITRNAIWREYRPGQEVDKNPSRRYMAVQRLAVAESAFRPHDEEAARICAIYLVEAERWAQRAIAAGEGDPLSDLMNKEKRPSAETLGPG